MCCPNLWQLACCPDWIRFAGRNPPRQELPPMRTSPAINALPRQVCQAMLKMAYPSTGPLVFKKILHRCHCGLTAWASFERSCHTMGMGVVWTSPGSGGVDKGSTGCGGGTFGLVAIGIFQGVWLGWLGGSESSGRCGRSRIIASPISSRPSLGKSGSKAN